jgi:hypothetical protein
MLLGTEVWPHSDMAAPVLSSSIVVEAGHMKTALTLCVAGLAVTSACSNPAIANDSAGPAAGPAIDAVEWNGAETVCEAWPAGIPAEGSRAAGLSFVSYPAAVKPFGMRAYMAIDGKSHPLKQIAYANTDGTLSIYYRTLGDYHYDVYLTLSGFTSDELKGDGLSGKLVASRFGLFSQIEISGRCGLSG